MLKFNNTVTLRHTRKQTKREISNGIERAVRPTHRSGIDFRLKISFVSIDVVDRLFLFSLFLTSLSRDTLSTR